MFLRWQQQTLIQFVMQCRQCGRLSLARRCVKCLQEQHEHQHEQEDPIEFSDTEQESTIYRDSIEDSDEEKKATKTKTKTKNGAVQRPFLLPPLAKPKRRKLGKKKETYTCLTFK